MIVKFTYTRTHTHQSHFPNIFVQAMTCSIAIALEHIAIQYAKQRNKISYEIITLPHQHTAKYKLFHTECSAQIFKHICEICCFDHEMVEWCQMENILTMKWSNDIVWKIFRPWNGQIISYDICLTMRLGKHYEFLTILL